MAKLHLIVSRGELSRGSVIFVHGLNGHPFKTWGGTGPKDPNFWPQWLANEPGLERLNIYVLEYEAAALRIFGHAMSLLDDSKSILPELKGEEALFRGPIAFICHSLGGIVLKQILRDVYEEKDDAAANALLDRLSQVIFVATPHKGATLALVAQHLPFLFQFKTIIRSLRKGNEALLALGHWYTNFCGAPDRSIKHLVFSERWNTHYVFKVVDAASSQAGVRCDLRPISANHIAIAKPPDRGAPVYKQTVEFLKLLPEERLRPFTREMRFSRVDEERVDAEYRGEPISDYQRRMIMGWLEPGLENTGWQLDQLQKGQGCTNVAYNRQLLTSEPRIPLRILPGLWKAYDNRVFQRIFAIKKAMRQSGDLFNARKIRLASDFIDEQRDEAWIQETDYLSSLTTDQLAWTQICSRQVGADGMTPEHVLWDGVSAFIEIDDQSETASLKSFGNADISNQLGGSTLAFSSDGHLMIVNQSRHNLQSESYLAPSGSGSFDWSDVAAVGGTELLAVARFGAERELREECALDDDGTGRPQFRSKLIVTGFARMLHRGGKPEFYCLARIDATYEELWKRKPERYVERVSRANLQRADWQRGRPREEIAKVCKDYRRKIGSGWKRVPMSYPLEHALILLIEACEDDASGDALDRFMLDPF